MPSQAFTSKAKGMGTAMAAPMPCCPCSSLKKLLSTQTSPWEILKNYKEALASNFHTEICDFPKQNKSKFNFLWPKIMIR